MGDFSKKAYTEKEWQEDIVYKAKEIYPNADLSGPMLAEAQKLISDCPSLPSETKHRYFLYCLQDICKKGKISEETADEISECSLSMTLVPSSLERKIHRKEQRIPRLLLSLAAVAIIVVGSTKLFGAECPSEKSPKSQLVQKERPHLSAAATNQVVR